jgi:hypothetical protein
LHSAFKRLPPIPHSAFKKAILARDLLGEATKSAVEHALGKGETAKAK